MIFLCNPKMSVNLLKLKVMLNILYSLFFNNLKTQRIQYNYFLLFFFVPYRVGGGLSFLEFDTKLLDYRFIMRVLNSHITSGQHFSL